MMGNRGSVSQTEYDAFSRHARRVILWHRRELRHLKRAYRKRMRKAARSMARSEASQLG
jgi:hypothetical protein